MSNKVVFCSLRERLRSSNYPEYASRYHAKQNRRKRFIPCSVDGVEYRSIGYAAMKLDMYPWQIKNRLASLDSGYVCADIPKKLPKPMSIVSKRGSIGRCRKLPILRA